MLLRQGLVDLGDGRFGPADVLVADGRIMSVARHLDADVDEEVVDCSGFLVVPGMVNAHAHSNENWFRGLFDSLPLELWELGAYPVFEGQAESKREIYVRTLLSGMESIRSGATCIADFLYELGGLTVGSLGPVVQAYKDLGLRALIVLGINDRPFRETIEMDVGLLDPDLLRRLEDETPQTWPELDAFIREERVPTIAPRRAWLLVWAHPDLSGVPTRCWRHCLDLPKSSTSGFTLTSWRPGCRPCRAGGCMGAPCQSTSRGSASSVSE